jgi:benzoylformate decarboxylase
VWVGLAEDVVAAPAVPLRTAPPRPGVGVQTVAAQSAITAAVHALANAQRPVIIAGAGVARSRASEAIIALAQRLGAPILNDDRRSLAAISVSNRHPLVAGYYSASHPAVVAGDVLAFFGTRFVEFLVRDVPMLPPGKTVIHAHRDDAEISALYLADIALGGDEGDTTRAVLAGLSDDASSADPRPAWYEPQPPRPTPAGDGFTPSAAMAAVAEVLSDDTIVVNDAVTGASVVLDTLSLHAPDGYHASTGGSLGWGVGAALGVKLAQPDRPVVSIIGDGAFQLGIQALWTASHYTIPVVYLIINNQVFAAIGEALQRFQGRAVQAKRWPGTDISGVNLAAVAAAFGLDAHRVTDRESLQERLRAALDSNRPTVIEIMTSTPVWG